MRSSLSDQMRIFLFVLSLVVSGCSPESAPAPSDPLPPATAPATAPSTTETTATAPESLPPAAPAAPRPPSRSDRTKPIKSFAVYTLSRGAGVPAAAREALQQVTNLVESDRKRGVKVTIQTSYIGLEGEKRLCAEYEDPREGARAWERAAVIVKGVDLVNLVAEPCQKKEETP